MCRPWRRMSSAVFTMTVTSVGGTARNNPRRNLPAPTPPASAVTFTFRSLLARSASPRPMTVALRSSLGCRDHADLAPPPDPARVGAGRLRQDALSRRAGGVARGAWRRARGALESRRPTAGPRTREHGHVLEKGLHPAHHAVPGPLSLLHLREASRQARQSIPHARTGRCHRRGRPPARVQGSAVHVGGQAGGAI